VVKKVNSCLLLLALFIGACSLNKNSNESADYIEAENLYQKKVKQYTFTLKPFSSEKLLATNYAETINTQSPAERDSIIAEYKNYLCFVFEIDIEGFHGDISDYEEPEPSNEKNSESKVSYYLFNMQNDFKLKSNNGSESPCVIYYYERLNEIAKTNRFIVGFKKGTAHDYTFEYNNPYFNCGKINFSINQQHLALN
jgi:hypothetical protein